MIGLVDCNNFYVSCERVFRPDLKNRPVVVLSGNDGCVIARSNEVKSMGIPMGAPYFKVKKILEDHNTAIFSSNFSLYGDLSARVMSIVESLVPKSEIYSIDEIFVDFTGIDDPYALARHIRETVLKQVGIPTSVGVSLTKTLAKVANAVAKKDSQSQGVFLLGDENSIDLTLSKMHPGDLWGIGKRSAEKLKQQGIETALQLKKADPTWMRKYFTVVGERLVRELNGMPCLELEDVSESKKSMQVTRTFAHGISDQEILRERIAEFASRISEKLRKQELLTQSIGVYIRTNRYRETDRQYGNYAVQSLSELTNDTFLLLKACTDLLESLYRPGYSFHKAGVMVHDLVPEKSTRANQLSLFDNSSHGESERKTLLKAIDSLNQRYGSGTIRVAASGVCQKGRGISPYKQSHKSPAYTTRWKELPIVK